MNFVKFTEYNDWEGETWHFWLQLDGNVAELQKLSHHLEGNEDFRLSLSGTPESEVDILVKHDDLAGYMGLHNKVTGKFTCPEPDDDSEDWLKDVFYKGGIKEYFK